MDFLEGTMVWTDLVLEISFSDTLPNLRNLDVLNPLGKILVLFVLKQVKVCNGLLREDIIKVYYYTCLLNFV